MKRQPDIVVISDLHLGTRGCHATELLEYLKSIQPKQLILNGDIIDIWQFNQKYFPRDHMRVIQRILKMSIQGTKVHYVTGNHDEALRRFVPFYTSVFDLSNAKDLLYDQKRMWVIHGDVFDLSIQYSRSLAMLASMSYDLLIRINKLVNDCRRWFKLEPWSLAAKAKYAVKEAVKFVNNYEEAIINTAAKQGFDVVICGHIHQPKIRRVNTPYGEVLYLNSGDWVESLSALECTDGDWSLVYYHDLYKQKKNAGALKSDDDELDLDVNKDITLSIEDLLNTKVDS